MFISSTFRDTHAERDQLNRVVFPALEERLSERHCRLEPIDLRVGVETDPAQSEREREQRILKVCLHEIDSSRPFLLVILGDRYGWVPPEDRVVSATREVDFPTVIEKRSVTSLEIEYGLLQKDPTQRRHSLILLRDPLPYDRMGAQAAIYSEVHATDAGAPERARQLASLKTKLASDELLKPRVHRYSLDWDESAERPTEKSVQAWGHVVEEAIWQELDAETLAFARQPNPTWQEQERFALEEFTERLQRCFVGREALVEQAVSFAVAPSGADQASQSWCITAESGAGKSAFFSQVYYRLSGRNDVIVLAEAGGISPRAGRLNWTLRLWIEELAAATGAKVEVPEDLGAADLEKRFVEMLGFSAASRRVVILADALDQFERTDRMLSLSWLPDPLPPNVRFLATAIPGPETEKLSHRTGSRISPLPPFTEAEVEDVARMVYGRYHRTPLAEVIALLRDKRRPDGHPAAGNALWLTLALELLNLLDADDFAEAEAHSSGTPEEKLHRLVLKRCAALPPALAELYGVFLHQLEKTAGVVEARTFAALITLSRSGWSTEHLQQLLTPAATVLFPGRPSTTWDALGFATWRRFLRTHLVARGEQSQWDFAHTTLRQAVARRLVSEWAPQPGGDPTKALHSAIVDYLETLPRGAQVYEDEIMWQMLGTRDLHRFAQYYAASGSESGHLAEYLIEESHHPERPLLDFVRAATTSDGVPQEQQAAIGRRFNFDLHQALHERGGWALYLPLLEAAEALFARLRQRNPQSAEFARDLASSYSKLGDLHSVSGEPQRALEFYEKGLAIIEGLRRRTPDSAEYANDLTVSYERLGVMHLELGKPQLALDSYHKGLAITEELLRHAPDSQVYARNLGVSYYRLGELHRGLGELHRAIDFYQKYVTIAEGLLRRVPDSQVYARDLAIGYERLADAHHARGQSQQGLEFYNKGLAIAEELSRRAPDSADYAENLSDTYTKLGDLHLELGERYRALDLYHKALAIAEELRRRVPDNAEYASTLSVSYSRLGDWHFGLGESEQALEFYKKLLAVTEELRRRAPESAAYARELSVGYSKLGDVYRALEHSERALGFYQKSLSLREQLRCQVPDNSDYARDLGLSYERLGVTHIEVGDRQRALEFFQKSLSLREELRRRAPDSAFYARDLFGIYSNLGNLHKELDQWQTALEFFQKALATADEMRKSGMFGDDALHQMCQHLRKAIEGHQLVQIAAQGDAEVLSFLGRLLKASKASDHGTP